MPQHLQGPKAPKRPAKDAGFTIIEMIIVTAILGMMALILTIVVSKSVKRQRLAVGAQQIQSLMEKSYILTAQNRTSVFLILTPAYTDGTRKVLMRVDTDGNGQLSSTELTSYSSSNPAVGNPLNDAVITSDLVVTACNWPSVTVGGATLNVLLCDSLGHTMNPSVNPATQFAGGLLSLTHKDMTGTSPSLHPHIRYDISLGALWHVKLASVRY